MSRLTTGQTILLWIIALVLTVGAAVFQRMTGPTYPVGGELVLDDHSIEYSLPRSNDSGEDARIALNVPQGYKAILEWRRVNSSDRWQGLLLRREGDSLVTLLPRQPPAGKIRYKIKILTPDGARVPLTNESVVIRFKGSVPAFALIPHIALMFLSMLLAARTGIQAGFYNSQVRRIALATTVCLIIGGLILGPVVQKYAFGAFWTGWPFGHDLTDNKTAVAVIFWLIALWRGWRNPQARLWYVVAAFVHFAVYLVPHSVLGSELDYMSTGE